jgi:hypothetical protein
MVRMHSGAVHRVLRYYEEEEVECNPCPKVEIGKM